MMRAAAAERTGIARIRRIAVRKIAQTGRGIRNIVMPGALIVITVVM